MTIAIVLTSYNRPAFLPRAVESVLDQDWADWRLFLMDDWSDDEGVISYLAALADHGDPRITITRKRVRDRSAKTRYSVLINRAYKDFGPEIDLVLHLCDNVELMPGALEAAAIWAQDSEAKAGYWRHKRFIATSEGEVLGPASIRRHWTYTPDIYADGNPIASPGGLLDHSQVVIRWPFGVRWNEGREALRDGDARFFNALVHAHGPIAPITEKSAEPYTREYLIYD